MGLGEDYQREGLGFPCDVIICLGKARGRCNTSCSRLCRKRRFQGLVLSEGNGSGHSSWVWGGRDNGAWVRGGISVCVYGGVRAPIFLLCYFSSSLGVCVYRLVCIPTHASATNITVYLIASAWAGTGWFLCENEFPVDPGRSCHVRHLSFSSPPLVFFSCERGASLRGVVSRVVCI